jgi:predicted RND superfamily exporter protein
MDNSKQIKDVSDTTVTGLSNLSNILDKTSNLTGNNDIINKSDEIEKNINTAIKIIEIVSDIVEEIVEGGEKLIEEVEKTEIYKKIRRSFNEHLD